VKEKWGVEELRWGTGKGHTVGQRKGEACLQHDTLIRPMWYTAV